MKSLRTKVILSAFVLLFALVATIGSTYAWFTVSNTASVSEITVTVTTEESLLIRVYDGETETGTAVSNYTFDGHAGSADDFVNTVSESLIIASSQYSSFASYLLKPVTAGSLPTTTNGTDYTVLDMDALSTIDITAPTSRTLSAASANQTSGGGYIELKFWLMVQTGTDVTVKVSSFSATGATVSQAMYLGAKSEIDANERIYAINSDWGFVFGETDTGYSATAALNSIPTGTKTTLAAAESATSSTAAGVTLVTLSADIPELVTVRLWIEGWDAQATNSLMGETTDISFAFSIFTVA